MQVDRRFYGTPPRIFVRKRIAKNAHNPVTIDADGFPAMPGNDLLVNITQLLEQIDIKLRLHHF